MKGRIKKWLLPMLLLALSLLMALTVSAQNGELEFAENADGTYSVLGIGNYSGSDIVIPSTHEGKPVTKIADNAFYDKEHITSLKVADSVQEIGVRAFHYCIRLESIELGNGVKSLGEGAFFFCTALENVDLGNNLAIIGENAFYNCIAIDTLVIPDSVTDIGNMAFKYCDNLIQLTLGKGLVRVGAEAFVNCYKLVEVYNLSSFNVGYGITDAGYAGAYSMAVHNSLESESLLTFAEGGYVFAYKYDKYFLVSQTGSEKELVLPDSINGSKYEIGSFAFYNRTTLEKIDMGNGITAIGNAAFYFCGSLTEITIPHGVTSVGSLAFSDCHSLVTVELPGTLAELGMAAFQNCYDLSSIKIPDSVTYLGQSTFNSCFSLETVVLPKNLEVIDVYVFYDCEKLKKITLPSGLLGIGEMAFAECEALESIYIPSSVYLVQANVFENCKKLKIYCQGNTDTCTDWDANWNISNCYVEWNAQPSASDAFVFLGYSTDGKRICAGYSIDYVMVDLYESVYEKELDFGLVFASFELLGGKSPLDSEANPTSLDMGKVIKHSLKEYSFLVYDFVLTDLTEELYNHKFVIAGYTFDGEEVLYVQENNGSSVNGKSYNEMINSVEESAVYEDLCCPAL